jgi:hypothetical protein
MREVVSGMSGDGERKEEDGRRDMVEAGIYKGRVQKWKWVDRTLLGEKSEGEGLSLAR